MNAERYLSANELAEAVGCTRKAVRLYEAHGLLAPARRHGSRRYGTDAYQRLGLIVALRAMDVSISDIAALFARRSEHHVAGLLASELSNDVGELVRDATRRLEQLVQVRDRLIRTRDALANCSACIKPAAACAECASTGRLDPTTRVLLAGSPVPPEREPVSVP
jgi:DNA-binding transcriptional MerR regulator